MTTEVALQCVRCQRRKWVVDFGFGRLCSECDQQRRESGGRQQPSLPIPMPTHQPARAFNEAAERDEQPEF